MKTAVLFEPFASSLQKGEFLVHLYRHGDIFIMDSQGLLAANRKWRWRVAELMIL